MGVRHHVVEQRPGGAEAGEGFLGRVAAELAAIGGRKAIVGTLPGRGQGARVEAVRGPVGGEDANRIGAEHGAEVWDALGHRRADEGVNVQAAL